MRYNSMLKVTVLTNEARRELSDLEKDQFPFALAKTLTEVAALAVQNVQKATRERFRLHSEFIPKGIGRTQAKKTDVKNTGIGSTVVFTKPIISGWMPTHETGDERKPRGKALAIPATDLLKHSYRTGSGKVRRQWRPEELLKAYTRKRKKVSMTGGLTKATKGGKKGKPFVVRGKGSNVPMIVRRKGTKRYPLELLYIFARKAEYKPVWGFEKAVDEIVDLRFKSRLNANLKQAVANSH